MEEVDFISKTRRKREMAELQDLGAALVKLSGEQLARIEMPEELREAVAACRTYNKHEAIRRQMQYIGKIMRNVDAAPIAEQLAQLHAPSSRQTALFHTAEKWRDDMMADVEAVARFALSFPRADATRLRSLVEKARAERAADQPPRAVRALFHAVNTTIQQSVRGNES